MRKLAAFILILFLFNMSNSYAENQKIPDMSDIRIEIKSQIKVLKEKKELLLKKLSESTEKEKKEIKKFIKRLDERIKHLKKLIDKYTEFNSLT